MASLYGKWKGIFAVFLFIPRFPDVNQLMEALVDGPRLAVHVVHQQILAQIIRRGEIGFAAA
jgi:hypothetical protein